MRDDETETIRADDTPAPLPQRTVPILCRDQHPMGQAPAGACRWDQERGEIMAALNRLGSQMGQVLQRLAAGSERMKGLNDLDDDLAALRSEVAALRGIVADLKAMAAPSAAAIAAVKAEVDGLRKDLSDHKDSMASFPLVKTIVFGGTGMILMAVMGALIALVVIK
jgi:hypothetical protein